MIRVRTADTDELREKAFTIRHEVFVVEQNVSSSEEFDEYEAVSHHFIALDEQGAPIGAARWRKTDKGIKLERFAVKKSKRGQGVGKALVNMVLQDVRAMEGKNQYLYLHAQLPAVPLYEKFGFEVKGDQFLECDILHYLMWRLS